MAEINPYILNKLNNYDKNVQELCHAALIQSENMPPATVVEFLKNLIRTIAKQDYNKNEESK